MSILASSDDALGGLICFILVILLIVYFFRGKDSGKPPTVPFTSAQPPAWKAATTSQTGSAHSLFDPFRDARVVGGIQGMKNHIVPGFCLDHVEAVTLNDDFIAISRSDGRVQAILLDTSLVMSLQLGEIDGYPSTRYHMIMSHGQESAAFPVCFHGWLHLFDACKKSGGLVEAADEISDEMRIKVLGAAGAARIPAASKAAAVARPTKCASCGAALNKHGPCDYCGSAT